MSSHTVMIAIGTNGTLTRAGKPITHISSNMASLATISHKVTEGAVALAGSDIWLSVMRGLRRAGPSRPALEPRPWRDSSAVRGGAAVFRVPRLCHVGPWWCRARVCVPGRPGAGHHTHAKRAPMLVRVGTSEAHLIAGTGVAGAAHATSFC